ncbi:MAG: patatin-like phospholipase family protein [Hyphomicrobiales bacterium]|nr:patatin-like phospholipase family protein [Hyphomicrobiales bacterium]
MKNNSKKTSEDRVNIEPTEQLRRRVEADPQGTKRILALDGGGVFGVIEIAFLERIEEMLRQRYGKPDLVLSDYFDLIGGTSTGSIIATALALGMPMSRIKELYFESVKVIFRKPWFAIPLLTPRFDESGLMFMLNKILGDEELQSDKLKTGLVIVSKRIDTAAVWALSNNYKSKYWNDGPKNDKGDPDPIGNRYYRLKDIVRASTAAPTYFRPHCMNIIGKEDGLFCDGGVSPHNNPSLLMLMMAGIEGYNFNWPINRDQLMMISIGTGWLRPRIKVEEARRWFPFWFGIRTLRGLIWDGQVNALTMMQWLSNPRAPWWINGEIGSVGKQVLSGQGVEFLKFQRYDLPINPIDVNAEAGSQITDQYASAFTDMMNPAVMRPIYELAVKAAHGQVHPDGKVHPDDFPPGFDIAPPVAAQSAAA